MKQTEIEPTLDVQLYWRQSESNIVSKDQRRKFAFAFSIA